MSTTAYVQPFEQLGLPIAPINVMGLVPSEANAAAAGVAVTATLVKDPAAGSWAAAQGAIAGVGYLGFEQTDNGGDGNGVAIRVLTTRV